MKHAMKEMSENTLPVDRVVNRPLAGSMLLVVLAISACSMVKRGNDPIPPFEAGPVSTTEVGYHSGVIEGVNFAQGTATLTEDAKSVLSPMADSLREDPDVRIVIESHTDNRGPATFNLELSKKRALAVANYLIDQGIDDSRLDAIAYGESKPLMQNSTLAGRIKNRRIELKLVRN